MGYFGGSFGVFAVYLARIFFLRETLRAFLFLCARPNVCIFTMKSTLRAIWGFCASGGGPESSPCRSVVWGRCDFGPAAGLGRNSLGVSGSLITPSSSTNATIHRPRVDRRSTRQSNHSPSNRACRSCPTSNHLDMMVFVHSPLINYFEGW